MNLNNICNLIYKLGVLVFAALLCWYFNNLWGCLALFLITEDI